MKIAYVTLGTPHDKNSWSGTNYYVKKALEHIGCTVYCIYGYRRITLKMLFYKVVAKLFGKNYQGVRSLSCSKGWAKFIVSHLQPETDAILSLSTIPVACLETSIPIFVYVDGVYEYMLGQGFTKLLNKLEEAHRIEKYALERCKRVFTSSIASAEVIKKYYGISEKKIGIIPLGANLNEIPSKDVVMESIRNKDMQVCRVLFVGVEWNRKGADIVLRTAKLLYDTGFPVELHLVGLREIPVQLPPYVVNHGFISKMGDGLRRLTDLYKNSHFLFVPSVAEAFGLVFCEAGAYGLPSISHNVGGIPTIIINGVNGQLFDLGTEPAAFADYIRKIFVDKDTYKELCRNSYLRFLHELNWTISGKKLLEQMSIAM